MTLSCTASRHGNIAALLKPLVTLSCGVNCTRTVSCSNQRVEESPRCDNEQGDDSIALQQIPSLLPSSRSSVESSEGLRNRKRMWRPMKRWAKKRKISPKLAASFLGTSSTPLTLAHHSLFAIQVQKDTGRCQKSRRKFDVCSWRPVPTTNR